jgi:hypothetical protein
MVCLGGTRPVLVERSIVSERKGALLRALYLWDAKKELFNLFETPKVQKFAVRRLIS